jgi:hypothetical protein
MSDEFNITFRDTPYSGGAVIPTPGLLEEVNQRSSTSAAIAELKKEIEALSRDKPTESKKVKPWHGTGQPPKTKTDKLSAIQAWDSMSDFDRPSLEEWLESNFGSAPNGDLAVAVSTFHGWRKIKKP